MRKNLKISNFFLCRKYRKLLLDLGLSSRQGLPSYHNSEAYDKLSATDNNI